jgi:hypothetical protein
MKLALPVIRSNRRHLTCLCAGEPSEPHTLPSVADEGLLFWCAGSFDHCGRQLGRLEPQHPRLARAREVKPPYAVSHTSNMRSPLARVTMANRADISLSASSATDLPAWWRTCTHHLEQGVLHSSVGRCKRVTRQELREPFDQLLDNHAEYMIAVGSAMVGQGLEQADHGGG